MFSQAREIAAGDVVIVWFTRDSLKAITIAPGEELNGRFGAYRHADLIGKPFGSKIGSRNGKGFIYVLRPTPELWTLALPHRTQILYVADIAFVVSWLGIKPGSVVIEAGTGSGSFSHSVSRTIGKSGRLHSFEFHETRCQAAQEEFAQHGMSEYVTVSHRNVCKEGFGLENAVDAVFLDLPAPWEAIPAAKQSLKKTQSTRICCFSPCAEQVLRTVSALNDSGFTSITMYETLLRTIDVGSYPPLKSVGTVAEKLRDSDVKREARRIKQIEESAIRAKEKGKKKAGESSGQEMDVEDAEHPHGQKRKAGEDHPTTGQTNAPHGDDSEAGPTTKKPKPDGPSPVTLEMVTEKAAVERISLGKPFPEQRGHTSYLTFAILLPTIYPGAPESANAEHAIASGESPDLGPSEGLAPGAEP
ncbi:tRNA (adenine-N(1)-)-methyltransferase catalytic subunit trm61 [Tulasnella sp. 424]|nr:tRNA (adenine-N(1)-)-methyltransferase catalytic subunit trm61 [Tulasnella sp. 424]KAG8974560.1 tRNA (adenine-N(1)-)-methyltransferase catalytic subunit trm61 [Tulasnella sp. 425]